MSLQPKLCEWCDNEFTPSHDNQQRFCSRTCASQNRVADPNCKKPEWSEETKVRRKAYWDARYESRKKPCEQCGNPIPRSGKKTRRFCSKACADVHHSQHMMGVEKSPEAVAAVKAAWEQKREARKIECKQCHMKFLPRPGQEFCSRKCSMMWRTSRVDYKHPMTEPHIRAKMTATMQRLAADGVFDTGRRFFDVPPLQRQLADALGRDWILDFPVATGHCSRVDQSGYPTVYWIDIANPAAMLAVEVDGPEHKKKRAQKTDAMKTAFLTRLGWKVLRFTNEEVQSSTELVVEKITSTSTISRSPVTRRFLRTV